MTIADKLYDILHARYDRLWRTADLPVGFYFGGRHIARYTKRDDLLLKWHGVLRSHGMTPSEEFSEPPTTICVKDPAMLNNEWILVPEELAFKIVALGALP